MKSPRWVVTYKAVSDGRQIEIYCSTQTEANAFAEMVRKVDRRANPQIEQRSDGKS